MSNDDQPEEHPEHDAVDPTRHEADESEPLEADAGAKPGAPIAQYSNPLKDVDLSRFVTPIDPKVLEGIDFKAFMPKFDPKILEDVDFKSLFPKIDARLFKDVDFSTIYPNINTSWLSSLAALDLGTKPVIDAAILKSLANLPPVKGAVPPEAYEALASAAMEDIQNAEVVEEIDLMVVPHEGRPQFDDPVAERIVDLLNQAVTNAAQARDEASKAREEAVQARAETHAARTEATTARTEAKGANRRSTVYAWLGIGASVIFGALGVIVGLSV